MSEPRDDERIVPCTELPTIRRRTSKEGFKPHERAVGYTSPGHVEHFLPDREVSVAGLNKALVDVFGEPGIRIRDVHVEIDEDYWKQVCSDPWSGNIYRYSF